MSQRINSKNLSYETNLPPFLARLHAQASGSAASGPDPLLAGHRRSIKKRSGSEEAEDAPVVVDEDGNVVDLEVDKDGTVKSKEQIGEGEKADEEVVEVGEKERIEGGSDAKAMIGGRKRKVGKIIGEAADEDDNQSEGAKSKDKPNNSKEKDTKEGKSQDRRPKKKAKKVKLSFDDDDEEG